jgi:hypothetical protein
MTSVRPDGFSIKKIGRPFACHGLITAPDSTLVFLASAHTSRPSSSILGSSGTRSVVGLADATFYWPSSTILGHRLARTGCSLALHCVVWKKCEKRMLQAYISSVSDVFVGMLQVFHMDVVKVG